MTREEAKTLLPIIQAYSEGKTIEYLSADWEELENPIFNDSIRHYRVKPEPKCRPFKTGSECWEEMKKHEPLGWVKHKQFGCYMCIGVVDAKGICFGSTCQYNYQEIFDKYTFIDGVPFGIKEN